MRLAGTRTRVGIRKKIPFKLPTGRAGILFELAAIALVVTVAAVTALVVLSGPPGQRINADFTLATGVYKGSDVRVLGVKVGTIDSVRPEGSKVHVTMTVDHGVSIPAGAQAVVMAPGLVADRYIQLAPAYTGGPKMASGETIPLGRTVTPLEINQLYNSISKLATDLGPNGINKNGALSDALNTGAQFLQGTGTDLHTTIQNLGEAAKTLTGSRNDLFSTIDNLSTFTTMLARSDGQVKQAETELASVSSFLAADRQDLGTALSELAPALEQVQGFIQKNRKVLADNLDNLATITQVVVNQRKSLAEALDVLPLNAQNVVKAYNANNHALMGRTDMPELTATGYPPLALPSADGSAG